MLGKYVYPLQAIVCIALALSACAANGQQNVTANYVATSGAQLSSAVSALNGTSTGGSIVLASNVLASITGQLQIQKPMTITCMASSSISEGSTGSLFVVTASNFVLQNCNVTDTNSGSSALAINSASNFSLLNNTINGAVHMQGATHGLIQGNTVNGTVFGEDNTSYIQAVGNYITTASGGGSSLQFHGTSSGETVSHLALTGNHMINGGTYCVEVGAFGSGTVPPMDVIVTGNVCDLSGSGTSGGYSFDTVVAPVISNNTFNSDGQTALVAGIEIVNSYIVGVSGVPTGPGTGAILRGNNLFGAGITLNKQSNNLVDGNYIDMGSTTVGLYVGGDAYITNYNQIRNNTIVCTGCVTGSTHYKLIWVQNNPGANTTTVLGTQITGNHFIGKNAGEYGVWLEADGTYTTPMFGQTVITGNVFDMVSNDIHPQSNTFNTYLYLNACNASSTWIPTSLPSNVTILGESTSTCSISQ